MVQAGHHDQKFVCYPIRCEPDGRMLTNWIAEMRVDPAKGSTARTGNREADRERRTAFLPHFASWTWGWLDVPGLIARQCACWNTRWWISQTFALSNYSQLTHPLVNPARIHSLDRHSARARPLLPFYH
jgi:hypothetical protein